MLPNIKKIHIDKLNDEVDQTKQDIVTQESVIAFMEQIMDNDEDAQRER